MSLQSQYEFLVLLLMAVIVLELAARRLHLPPAAALIVGGMALAFVPGLPTIVFDPHLVLVVFLPPLLLSSAYATVWRDFKRHSATIISLAVGAVFFTSISVGIAFHFLFPDLPWAAGLALGAAVSPPDAVAVKAVLEKLRLPTRITTVLGGESLVNDASGLVLFHFAVAWTVVGSFSTLDALGTFTLVAAGGIAIGFLLGYVGVLILQRLASSELVITGTMLLAASSYIVAERLGLSGVLSTVTTGLLLGWRQHEIFSAATRITAGSFWKILIFLMQSMLFILVGLSLRGILDRIESSDQAMSDLIVPATIIVVVVLLSRFVWLLGSDLLWFTLGRIGLPVKRAPAISVTLILGWAGIRGPVTLAAALALPESFPGRDVILVSAFGVIFVTVLAQGASLPLLVKVLPSTGIQTSTRLAKDEALARMNVSNAQFAAFSALSSVPPTHEEKCLLDHYHNRAARQLSSVLEDEMKSEGMPTRPSAAMLAAIKAGRLELLRMYRTGEISDGILRKLEQDLDIQEFGSQSL